MFEIGLADLPKSGGGGTGPPATDGPAYLVTLPQYLSAGLCGGMIAFGLL